MGYDTRFIMRLIDLRPGTGRPVLDATFLNGLCLNNSHPNDEEWRGEDSYEFGEEACKWYDHDAELQKVSADWPDVVFILDGEGEAQGDVWREFYLNGKCHAWTQSVDERPEWSDKIRKQLEPVVLRVGDEVLILECRSGHMGRIGPILAVREVQGGVQEYAVRCLGALNRGEQEGFCHWYRHEQLERWSNKDREAWLSAYPTVDDATGFNVAPVRYSKHGRETIDRIRDRTGAWFRTALEAGLSVDDAAFVTYCRAANFKYDDRLGLKDAEEQERKKAQFFGQMADHVERPEEVRDPRAYRAGFALYVKQELK